MAIGKPLHLRLFLEGIEVPVIAATVTAGTNAPASASIQIIPLDSAIDFKPRTMVHLFFLDAKASRGEKGSMQFSKTEGVYRLLFAGEMHGFQFVQTPMSRAVVLQCLDFSSYWDAAHATAIEYGPFGNMFAYENLAGGNAGVFDNIVNQQAQVVSGWLRQRPRTPGLTGVSGVAGGLIHMMEAMAGYSSDGKHTKGINDFFTVSELRCRLMQQMTAEENDSTAANLMSNRVFMEWLKGGLSNAGQNVTFRDMLLLLMQYIYYENVPVCAPYWTESVKGQTKTSAGEQKPLADTKAAKNVLALIAEASSACEGGAQKDGPGDKGTVNRAANARLNIKKALETLARMSTTKDVDWVVKDLNSADSSLKTVQEGKTNTSIFWTAKGYLDAAKKTISESQDSVKVAGTTTTTSEAQRLRTQIIRPDCWFTVPPTCNIIFPEHFTQISYDRVWTQEVTRVLIHAYNSLIGRDALVNDTRILAPSSDGIVTVSNINASRAYRKLMKHEFHTGIIPREETLPDTHSVSVAGPDGDAELRGAHHSWSEKVALFHFFKYRYAPRQVQVAGRFNPYIVCGFPGVVLRAPYMPPPDKLAGLDTDEALYQFVNDNAAELGAPYHFIGLVNGLTHQIDQQGGTTTISMHSARRHSGVDDEFMSIVKGTTKTKPTIVRVSLTAEMAKRSEDAFNLLRDMTPQGPEPKIGTAESGGVEEKDYERTNKSADGSTSTVKGKTKAKRKSGTQSRTLPFTVRGDITEAEVYGVLKPGAHGQKIMSGYKGGFFTNSEIVGIEVKAEPTDTSAIEVIERDFETVNLYRAVVVYQKVEIPQPQEVPLEQVLKPGWFSPAYDPVNVGKRIYQEFFGCDSIIDGMTVNSGSQSTSLRTGKGEKPPENPTVAAVDGDGEVVGDVFVEDISGKLNNPADMTTERALNTLAFIYGRVKATGQDVDDFIQQIIYRPIATKDQVLGEEGIEVVLGAGGLPEVEETVWTGEPGVFRKGKLGFHTLALHPNMVNNKEPLAGLLYDPELKMQRASGHGSKAPIDPTYDVRREKWARVKTYADALVGARGKQGLLG